MGKGDGAMRKMFFVLLLFIAAGAYADVPKEVTYQGRLREYGQPVNGTRTMDFRIYSSASGPGLVWESGNVSVDVTTGTFSFGLTPNVDWRQKDYWIETTINGKTLSPREKITAQVYALHAGTAEDIEKKDGDTINFVIGSSTKATISSSGEVSSMVNGTTFYMVPRGAIIMWSGTLASIPSGWALCDGTNGTPDLRDRFVCGVNIGQEPGDGIYSSSIRTITSDQLPSHTHNAQCGIESNDHVHQMSHKHAFSGTTSIASDWAQNLAASSLAGGDYCHNHTFSGMTDVAIRNTNDNTYTEGQNQHHTHNITVNDVGQTRGNAIDFRPRYYQIAFIMKQ